MFLFHFLNTFQKIFYFYVLNLLYFFSIPCLFAFTFAQVQFNIELSSDTYQSGEDLLVHWELNTEGKGALLKWGTPLEGDWNSNMFFIESESQYVPSYQGKIMKRAAPSLEDFQLFSSDLTSGSLVLSEGYKFEKRGSYSVTLKVYIVLLSGEVFSTESNTVTFTVARPDFIDNSKLLLESRRQRTVGFTSCSASEQSITNAAIPQATSASDNASQYMNQTYTPSCSSAYVTWFGTLTSGRWSKVQTDFGAIHSRLASRQFNIDCSCNQPGTYAFVYPNDPTHTIHLCPVFWDASPDPYTYNSQPGTLTHEMSHFDDVAGTGDYQYGVPGCYQLAESSPNVAVDNADSQIFPRI